MHCEIANKSIGARDDDDDVLTVGSDENDRDPGRRVDLAHVEPDSCGAETGERFVGKGIRADTAHHPNVCAEPGAAATA